MPILVGRGRTALSPRDLVSCNASARPLDSSHTSYNRISIIKAAVSPKKRERDRTPSPLRSPKVCIRPMDTGARSETDKAFTMDSEMDVGTVLPVPTLGNEFASWLKGVEPDDLLDIQKEFHGRLRLGKIMEDELENWKSRHAKWLENDGLKLEYNFISKSCMMKSLPLPIHDSLQIFFVREVNSYLEKKFGKDEAEDIAHVGSGTSML